MAAMLDVPRTDCASGAFMPGDLVQVRPESEILATLDDKGTLESLPFMPEMLKLCGQTFRVSRQAFKTCVDDQEMRGLERTVFLDEARCDGASHGGCDRACLIFWKEAWLKPVKANGTSNGHHRVQTPKLSRFDLINLAQQNGEFFCQSTEILNASTPLPWWDWKQYLWDLKYNRVSFADWIRGLFIAGYNKVAHVCKFNSWRFVTGPGSVNGEEPLNLQPGEFVRVKSLKQIKETLDATGKNQNLLFAPTMMSFCGQVLRVKDRVENIILEGTTRQRKIKDTVLLEGSICDGVCHRLCPRQSFLFWRECWLERVSPSS